MRLVAWTAMLGGLLLAASIAFAQDNGITRIEGLPQATPADIAALRAASAQATPAADSHRLPRADGWWRVQPAPGGGDRLLLVYHPYSARLTVLAPPDYAPVARSVLSIAIDRRCAVRCGVQPPPLADRTRRCSCTSRVHAIRCRWRCATRRATSPTTSTTCA
ncbi:MAG: hypothetical protein KIS72_04045 [Luteimonas sp.]|nr:hypothetical protein [Luteimonas sp.]